MKQSYSLLGFNDRTLQTVGGRSRKLITHLINGEQNMRLALKRTNIYFYLFIYLKRKGKKKRRKKIKESIK